MKQPKYSPEESLKRMKLMMEYDSSRTYTENKTIVEGKLLSEIALPAAGALVKLIAAALGIGAAAAVPFASEWASSSSKEKIKKLGQTCEATTAAAKALKRQTMTLPDQTKLAGLFRKSFDWTLGGFGIGAGTDLKVLRSALQTLETSGNFGDYCKVREIMGSSKFDEELIDELNTGELGEVASTVEVLLSKSQKGNLKLRDAETANEQWWLNTFPCVEVTDSFADPIVVSNDRYGNTYVTVNFKVKGQIKPFHLLQNGRLYTADTHKYTGKKIVCAGETKVTAVSESLNKKTILEQADLGNIDLSGKDSSIDNGGQEGGQRRPKRTSSSSFRVCSEEMPIEYGCQNNTIKRIQVCLGLTDDGKFGPKTRQALINVGDTGNKIDGESFIKAGCKPNVPKEETPKKETPKFEPDDSEESSATDILT
jgi:hypothetical protein